MGELLGVPDWVAATAFVAVCLALWLGFGHWRINSAHKRLLTKRPNPPREEFLRLMTSDCSLEAAQFVWDQALFYVQPLLTPHPDDHLFEDLKIDDEDVELDWTHDWAERQGFHESNYPDWPDGWPTTVRNFAKWLDMAPV